MSYTMQDRLIATVLIGLPVVLALIGAWVATRWLWHMRHWRPPGS